MLSYYGLNSTWVKFELGAAWGMDKPVIAVLGPGHTAGDKRLGPFGDMPCVLVSDNDCRKDLDQYFEQMADKLKIKQTKNSTSSAKLNNFINTYRRWGGAEVKFVPDAVKINYPKEGKSVKQRLGDIIDVEMSIKDVSEKGYIWVGILEVSTGRFWPKELVKVDPSGTSSADVREKKGSISAGDLGICVIGVGHAGNDRINYWHEDSKNKGYNYDPLELTDKDIPGIQILDTVKGLTLK